MSTADTRKAKIVLNIVRAALLILIAAGAVWYFVRGNSFSVEAVLSFTPENYPLAVGFMLLLYVVKTLLVFPPIMVLQIAVGLYVPTPAAILVNIAGVALELSLGYAMGRIIGFDANEKLFRKHPKLLGIISGTKNRWFISYILRALNMLPIDLVSMYLGTSDYPFGVYISGSLTGMLFGVLAATFIGMSLTDPTSPTFILACVLSLTLSGLSCLVYYILSKKRNKIGNQN